MPIELLAKLSNCEMPIILDEPEDVELATILLMAGLIKARSSTSNRLDQGGFELIAVSGLTEIGRQMSACFSPERRRVFDCLIYPRKLQSFRDRILHYFRI